MFILDSFYFSVQVDFDNCLILPKTCEGKRREIETLEFGWHIIAVSGLIMEIESNLSG